MRVLIKRLRVEIYVFKKSHDDLLKLFIHAVAQSPLHNADNLVVVIHSQNHLADFGNAFLVGVFLEFTDDAHYVSDWST